MTTFDERAKGFENKFAHDEELTFRIKARSHKLLGLWAAGKLGKSGPAAEGYASALVMADFDRSGPDDIIVRLLKDFVTGGVKVSEKDIRQQMLKCHNEAHQQLAGGA